MIRHKRIGVIHGAPPSINLFFSTWWNDCDSSRGTSVVSLTGAAAVSTCAEAFESAAAGLFCAKEKFDRPIVSVKANDKKMITFFIVSLN
jgi:hypothetical protein